MANRGGRITRPAGGPLSLKNRNTTLIKRKNDTGGWVGNFPCSNAGATSVTMYIADGLDKYQWGPLITREYDLNEEEKYKEKGLN